MICNKAAVPKLGNERVRRFEAVPIVKEMTWLVGVQERIELLTASQAVVCVMCRLQW